MKALALASIATLLLSLPPSASAAGEREWIPYRKLLEAIKADTCATVMGAVPQANAGIGKLAGMLSMYVPTMTSVIFQFDKPAQLIIKAKDGERRHASDAKHQVRLKLDKALLKENPLAALSERPFEAEIDSE